MVVSEYGSIASSSTTKKKGSKSTNSLLLHYEHDDSSNSNSSNTTNHNNDDAVSPFGDHRRRRGSSSSNSTSRRQQRSASSFFSTPSLIAVVMGSSALVFLLVVLHHGTAQLKAGQLQEQHQHQHHTDLQNHHPTHSSKTTSSSSSNSNKHHAAEMELVHASDVEVDINVVEEQEHTQSEYPSSFLLDEQYDATALYYEQQQVDHVHVDDARTYAQRYYKLSKYWHGPGSPILVIMGGEGALEAPPMLYPFVHEGLASDLGAFVMSPEHRFYGDSQPVPNGKPTVAQMMAYLSPDQALEDAIQLVQYVRATLQCDPDPTHPHYCPVITFGGSYPGFLSAMMRFRYPDIVDISYASSAPLLLYSQEVNSDAYFDKITDVAEEASTGCAAAVKATLYQVRDQLVTEYPTIDIETETHDASTIHNNHKNNQAILFQAAHDTGFCAATFPSYIDSIEEFVSELITYLVPAIFADFNMAYYPPGPTTALERACTIFQQPNTVATPFERLNEFFELRDEVEYGETTKDDESDASLSSSSSSCFDLSLELPDGPNSKIRGSDNSGTGGGHEGEIWEFQCCKDLVIPAGYSERSMFLPRTFSYDWHKQHCLERFPGIEIDPFRMNNEWKFDNLLYKNTSRIVFANGLRDGWSTSSITNISSDGDSNGSNSTLPYNLNTQIHVMNFPNGAHHSELKAGLYPNPSDTPDILHGYKEATHVLSTWLDEIYSLQQK